MGTCTLVETNVTISSKGTWAAQEVFLDSSSFNRLLYTRRKRTQTMSFAILLVSLVILDGVKTRYNV